MQEPLDLLHREGLWPLIRMRRNHIQISKSSALLVRPPISPRSRVSNQHQTYAVVHAAIKRSKTRVVRVWVEERLDSRERTQCGLGVLQRREPPENWVVGCETGLRKGDKTHDIRLESPTIYTYTLQDLLHFHDEACTKRE